MIDREDETTRLLRMIAKLLAVGICSAERTSPERERSQREKIRILASAGMSPTEIADLLGTTPNTVSVALVSIRREKDGKKAKSKPKKALKALPPPNTLTGDDPTEGDAEAK